MNIDEFVTKEQFDEFRNVDNFDNNTILNKRWNKVDELLSTFYTKNQKINRKIYDNLQAIFDGIKFTYEELYSYASMNDIAKLRRKIDDVKEQYGLDGYVGYKLNQYSKRKKLTNNDVLLALILIEYYKQLKEQDKEETILFDEIKNVVYRQAYKETIITVQNKKPKEEPKMPESAWIELLKLLTYMGYAWFDYKDGNAIYNSHKLLDLVVINIQQEKPIDVFSKDINKLLQKQQRAYFNKTIKEEVGRGYKDVYSGSIENRITDMVNRIVLKAMKDAGCRQVRFVAVLDDKTTKMCKTLDGQIFDIYNMNIYTRYSDEDKKNVKYKTLGLESGANLPPINNHFHYCRSTIVPFK